MSINEKENIFLNLGLLILMIMPQAAMYIAYYNQYDDIVFFSRELEFISLVSLSNYLICCIYKAKSEKINNKNLIFLILLLILTIVPLVIELYIPYFGIQHQKYIIDENTFREKLKFYNFLSVFIQFSVYFFATIWFLKKIIRRKK